MTTDQKLIAQVGAILVERSKKAIQLAREAILAEQFRDQTLSEALRYFMEESCNDAAHPTLLSLACEAVGGTPDSTMEVGSALVMLTSAADIHDDIIDKSETKDSRKTVYGKFGKDIAIVAADVLWIKGMLSLNEAAERFPAEKKQAILRSTKQAFFDLGSAEAKETSFRGRLDIDPAEFLEIIKLKVSVAVAAAKVGAVVGNGTPRQVENLGRYGEALGILTTIREDFINMFEPDELRNRFKNECLPLPILYAFKDPVLKQRIIRFLEEDKITEAALNKHLELIYKNPEVITLGSYMHSTAAEAVGLVSEVKNCREELVQLLEFTLQDLPS